MLSKLFFAFSAVVLLVTATVPAAASVSVAPEPSTFILMGGGIGALLVIRQLRNRKK